MLDIVQLKPGSDPRLQVLLNNVFSKVVLTKSYDEAMQVAQQHNLNCITTDFQVVYAGAFITKVGHYNRLHMDKFGTYQRLMQAKSVIQTKRQEIAGIQAERDQNDQQELKAQRDLQQAEMNVSKLRGSLHLYKTQRHDLESIYLQKKRVTFSEIGQQIA